MSTPAGTGIEPADVAGLIDALLAWYDQARRELPWRALPGRSPDPYAVLVSEFMLQQTTVPVVVAAFPRFMQRFPDLATLAAADLDEVLHAWQGLGYYRRARMLHACARRVVRDHGGRLPADDAALRALPGVGPYTAAALRAIAHDLPALPVDGNVERVLARLLAFEEPLPGARSRLAALGEPLLPATRAADFAQALMELGALVCAPRAPRCMFCPWRPACRAHARGIEERLPVRTPKPERPLRRGVAFLLRRPDGAILFRKRPPRGLLAGMDDLPASPWREGALDLDEALTYAPATTTWRIAAGVVRHVFTHFALELRLAEAETDAPQMGHWCSPEDLHRLALPTVTRKLLRHAGVGTG